MKIIESILTKNPCYSRGRKRSSTKGLMLHSVGCAQPSAMAFISNWNRPNYTSACVHGFIDANTGDVYQTLPWYWRGWHAASGRKGSANNTHIGVEMCEPDCIKYKPNSAEFTCSDLARAREMATRTYNSAVELFAMLSRQFQLNPQAPGVIISHSEGHKLGIASNHGDPEHLWRQLGLPYTMDTFRQDVVDRIGQIRPVVDTFEPYMVRVTISNLNIRTGPGTNYPKTGKYTGVGTFTIVAESNGTGASKWGKLKSGAGWISLDYAKKV